MTFADGTGTVLIGPEHPLVSVFRRAVRSGKHTGQWILLAVKDAPHAPPRFLGNVVWTPGGRFLFFHGLSGRVQSTHPDKTLNGKTLDHLTLELGEDMSRFEEHTAILPGGKGSRGQFRRGVVHDNHMHPWFSLLLNDVSPYELLPATFRFEFSVPSSDVARRSAALIGTAKRTVCAFPVSTGEGPNYYQLDVWAGRGEGWKHRHADALPWPTIPGVVDGHRGEQVARKGHCHELGDDCGIVTVLTRPSGVLRRPGVVHTTIEPIRR
jgi:hypothetical protein